MDFIRAAAALPWRLPDRVHCEGTLKDIGEEPPLVFTIRRDDKKNDSDLIEVSALLKPNTNFIMCDYGDPEELPRIRNEVRVDPDIWRTHALPESAKEEAKKSLISKYGHIMHAYHSIAKSMGLKSL
jgi:hypothetical protein